MTYKLWVDPVLPFSGWLLCHYELSISRHIEPTYELGCSGPHDPRIHDLAGMITDRTTPELTAFPVSLKLSNLSGFRIWDFCQKRHLATCDLVDLLCYRNLSKTGGPPGLSIWRDFLSSKNGAVFPVTGMTWDETMLSGSGSIPSAFSGSCDRKQIRRDPEVAGASPSWGSHGAHFLCGILGRYNGNPGNPWRHLIPVDWWWPSPELW